MSTARVPISPREARDQAAEYFGFTASRLIQVESGKIFEIPNPGLMDDDQQERWEELQFELENCDTEEDIVIPERTLEDGTVIPASVIPGDILLPHRINGALMKPPYKIKLAIALFGEEGYKEYKSGGGIANQIALEWARMNQEYQERVKADPKSEGSRPALEVVREGD